MLVYIPSYTQNQQGAILSQFCIYCNYKCHGKRDISSWDSSQLLAHSRHTCIDCKMSIQKRELKCQVHTRARAHTHGEKKHAQFRVHVLLTQTWTCTNLGHFQLSSILHPNPTQVSLASKSSKKKVIISASNPYRFVNVNWKVPVIFLQLIIPLI